MFEEAITVEMTITKKPHGATEKKITVKKIQTTGSNTDLTDEFKDQLWEDHGIELK